MHDAYAHDKLRIELNMAWGFRKYAEFLCGQKAAEVEALKALNRPQKEVDDKKSELKKARAELDKKCIAFKRTKRSFNRNRSKFEKSEGESVFSDVVQCFGNCLVRHKSTNGSTHVFFGKTGALDDELHAHFVLNAWGIVTFGREYGLRKSCASK